MEGPGEIRGSEVEKLKDEERQPCEVWTRVMGYHRPVSNFNPAKQQEWADRCLYETPESGADTETAS